MMLKLPSAWLFGVSFLASLASAERWILSVEPGVTIEATIDFIEQAFDTEIPILSNTTTLDGVSTTIVIELSTEVARLITDGIPGLPDFINGIPGFQFLEEDSQQTIPETTFTSQTLDGDNEDFVPYGIPMVQADQVDDSNTGAVTVCILDTGIDTDHPDLPAANIRAFDFTPSGTVQDRNGHGTHVAGTIAGVANGIGVVGVASSGLINIISMKVLWEDPDCSGCGYASWQIEAINKCAEEGANIVSMSLGGSFSQARQNAIDYHTDNSNMLFVAAAGNNGNSQNFYPASHESVISVAAVDSNKNKASFSQFNNQVELAAPGVGVWSTWLLGDYNQISGTSMACPHVSGVAALLWSHHPDKTNAEIRAAMQQTAEDLGVTGRDVDYGFGLVQALAAKEFLDGDDQGPPPVPETSPPEPETPECVTSPSDWTDSSGDGCEWYTSNWRCFMGIFYADENGITAQDACCECDGGAAGNCEDEPGWVDSLGDGCDWYEENDACDLYGDSFENDGLTASEACCACKGSTVTTIIFNSKGDDTVSPTFSPTLSPDSNESGASTVFSAFGILLATLVVAGAMVM